MKESDFRRKVNNYLNNRLGVYNIPYIPGEYGVSGVPDKLVCYDGHFVAIELKREDGVVDKLQRKQIRLINDNNGVAFVLRPSTFELACTLLELYDFKELRKLD